MPPTAVIIPHAMTDTPTRHRFQAAVETRLCAAGDGGYRVTAVTERSGLSKHDVVMDFRVLEAELARALAPFEGKSPREMAGMTESEPGSPDWPTGVAKAVAGALAPSLRPPVKLAAVTLADSSGRVFSFRP